MELHEFHNHEGAADKARLNLYTRQHKRRFIDPDDPGNSWQSAYNLNAVEASK